MKILTINVIGIPSGSDSNLIDANVFQDYDAVVVDPESLFSLYGSIEYYDRDEGLLTSNFGRRLFAWNIKRHEQIKGLLQRGGVIVCFMEPKVTYYYESEGSKIGITNYDWLLTPKDIMSELGGIRLGRGQTIDNIESGHPFSDYLNIKPPWSAYVDKEACQDWRILASAFGTHAVSIAKRVGLGHIILLPSYYDYNNGALIERCIEKLLAGREITPQPDWAKSILVPGQQELVAKITKVSDQINALEKQRETLIDADDKLERWKYLLYEKGKHRLEPVVREALTLLGCNVEPQPDKDSDGLVTFDYGKALLEVVGSEGTIKIEKLGQLTRNIASFFETKGSRVKGILVGNPFCGKSLDSRPPKDTQKQLFARELIESAEQLSITVLLSTDLYEVISRILEGKLTDAEKQSLRERIFNGKGLVGLA
jgi:hypothetical protein